MTKNPQRDSKLQHPPGNFRQQLAHFPSHHAVLAFSFIFVFGAFLAIFPDSSVSAKRNTTPVASDLPVRHSISNNISHEPVQPENPWRAITVKPGDNLSELFERADLTDTDMYQLLKSCPEAKTLTQLYPGQTVEFLVDNLQLRGLKLVRSPLEQLVFSWKNDKFSAELVLREPDIQVTYRQAELQQNLFVAAQNSGLSDKMTLEMANIFSGVIDFVYDPRPGDTFNVMYEEHYLDGIKLGEGNILAASYTNEDKTYNAYRYTDPTGETGYFNAEGESMRKAFLRAPLDFTRISSNFNPKRLHPVFKTTRPHRGVDYAAARGTPVFSTGNGRVLIASFSRANGNFVFVQHGPSYVTKYLHLDKRSVHTGQRVKQGQIIGKVGATGYATGPHLHYEFLVNGTHRNPRTVLNELPKGISVSAEYLAHFQANLRPIQQQFAAYAKIPYAQYAQSSNPVSSKGT